MGFARGRDGGRNTLAYLAWLRCRELIDAGKGSMLPDAPEGETLKTCSPGPNSVEAEKLLDSAFVKLRAEADAWQAARIAFMTRRLKEGRHPDTDRDFWSGYTEQPALGLPTVRAPNAHGGRLSLRRMLIIACLVVGIPVLAVGLAVGWVVRRVRNRRRKARSVEDVSWDALGGFR